MASKTYDPNAYDVIVAGIRLSGFAEGTFVSISHDSPGFSDKVGVDGEVARVRKHDRRATVTISLMQTSESNDELSQIYNKDRDSQNGAGVFSFRMVDRSGTTVFEADQAWIQSEPGATFSDEPESRDWEIRCANLRTFHGSNPDDG